MWPVGLQLLADPRGALLHASVRALRAKLGWLLIPDQQAVAVWLAAGCGEQRHIETDESLDTSPLFPGLQIDLEEIWAV